MIISLCLMVRNEQAKLAPCLQSAMDLVDETIVVDTGSTDGTRELAAKLGAKVFDFPWCDNFAAGRNECIRHATGDWIFWMDADERIDSANREKLRKLFQSLPSVSSQSSLVSSKKVEKENHGTLGTHGKETSFPSVSSVSSVVHTTDDSPVTNVAYVMKCLSVQPGLSWITFGCFGIGRKFVENIGSTSKSCRPCGRLPPKSWMVILASSIKKFDFLSVSETKTLLHSIPPLNC